MLGAQSLSLRGRAYINAVIAAGGLSVSLAVYELTTEPIGYDWLVLAALTIISGSATVKLPSIPASLSVSETFVFTSVLLFGPAAGTITVALDGLIISLWLKKNRKELHRVLFNMAAPALSIWLASNLFFFLAGTAPLAQDDTTIAKVLPELLLFTVLYFGLNSWLITFAVATETGEPALHIWKNNFLWLSLNFFCGASVAALLITLYPQNLYPTYSQVALPLLLILPLLFVLYLTYRTSMARVEDANAHLTQVNSLYLSTIETLAMAIDAKDQVTHGHIRRVQSYAIGLARAIGVNDPSVLHAVEAASLLHDMGKLAIPEHILNKPGRLTESEFEKMKLHAGIGADILSAINFPYPVVPIVRHHHENWDGTGYPDGVSGVQIPIGARILSVVDCFDALTSDRPYRPALSDDEAIQILKERRGTMYDPLVVDTFLQVYRNIGPTPSTSPPPKVISAIAHGMTIIREEDPRPSADSPVDDASQKLLIFSSLLANAPGKLGVSEICELAWYHLRRLAPLSLLAAYVPDDESGFLTSLVLVRPDGASEFSVRIPLGGGLSGWVAVNRQPIVNSDPRLDLGDRNFGCDLLSSCAVPLCRGDRLVGVLTLYSEVAQAYSEGHLNMLTILGTRIAVALDEAIALDKCRLNTRWDCETGLPNRQFLEEFICNSDSSDRVIDGSLMLVRVEGWSPHTLRTVASLLKDSLRVGDLVFRVSDGELACILAAADADTTRSVLQRISDALARAEGSLGMWVAAASPPIDGTSLEELFAAARARFGFVRRELLTRARTI